MAVNDADSINADDYVGSVSNPGQCQQHVLALLIDERSDSKNFNVAAGNYSMEWVLGLNPCHERGDGVFAGYKPVMLGSINFTIVPLLMTVRAKTWTLPETALSTKGLWLVEGTAMFSAWRLVNHSIPPETPFECGNGTRPFNSWRKLWEETAACI